MIDSMRSASLWLLTLAAVVGLSSGLAVMSVDLGAEWIKVAVVSPGVPMEIALNAESKRKTSVVVSLKDGERKFGSEAMNVCVKSPKNCYVYLLDLLGKKIDHPAVVAYKKRFPHYKLVEEPVRGTVLFQHSDDVTYSPEELMGMILAHAKGQAEAYTEQKIKDAVITVPVYFNQAERLSLMAAAEMGGLNVLQLISEPAAVALNYGMFRRKEINGTVKNMMFYDMGAQDTTVSIVGYQIVKTKERGFTESHPQAQILGVGYDRHLGGAQLKFNLREYLADEFNKLGKTKTDVRTVPRAMGKLLKEAERVKLILSANTECFAQIENLLEEIDYKLPLNRDKLVELGGDMWSRVTDPIDRALEAAAMTMDSIDQIILVGGGTRVPKVQELLTAHLARDLGKNINTDEAAAMGAVYKAADLSTGFKVKKFITKEAVIFPIDVDFEREIETDEGGKAVKKVKRTLFAKMNPFPQKKIMTFNKHTADFVLNVNYDNLDYLGKKEIGNIGPLNLSTVQIKGVSDALTKNSGDNVESKGVKAHFQLDDSGVLTCTGVEAVFEKTVSPDEQEASDAAKKEDTWSKLGDTISQFFSGDDKKDGGGDSKAGEKGEQKKDKPADDKTKADDKKEGGKKEEEAAKKEQAKDKKAEKKEEKKEPKKPKVETIKEELSMEATRMDVAPLDGDVLKAGREKLEALDKADQDRVARESALNELQSFVYDMQDKLYQEEYESASTEEERESIRTKCTEVSDWLDEEAGVDTELKEFTDRLKSLKELTASLFARVREHQDRPEVLEILDKTINSSMNFLEKSRNLTEDGLFKEKELDALQKKIEEIEKWKADKMEEQSKTPLSEMPKLTVSLIQQKVVELDSEVKFLVNKAKMIKAEREREKRLKEAEEKKAAEEAKKKAKKEAKEKKAEEKKADEEKDKEEGSKSDEDANKEGEEDEGADTSDEKPTDSPTDEQTADTDTKGAADADDKQATETGEDAEKEEKAEKKRTEL